MRKLQSILKSTSGDLTLKVWENKDKLRVDEYDKNGECIAFSFFDKGASEKEITDYFYFGSFYRVPFERKNGKIILYPINKMRRIIWSNNDYDEWCKAMEEEITDEEITPEYYHYCRDNDLDDERANLNVEVDGYIVAFARLGLWNGNFNGAKLVGTNVNQILSTSDDYATWYCDLYNVKCETIHHDGRNYILYRVAENKDKAETLANKIAYGGMNEKEFRKATESLRPYIAKVYGWKDKIML